MIQNNEQEIKVPQVMFFDNDDDFYTFCVTPQIVARNYINHNGEMDQYGDFDFTPAYNDAINKGIQFVILDPNSQIIKHNNVVSYRTISKKVQNLNNYRYGNYLNKVYPDFKPINYVCDDCADEECDECEN